jgi:hypothetical protein
VPGAPLLQTVLWCATGPTIRRIRPRTHQRTGGSGANSGRRGS